MQIELTIAEAQFLLDYLNYADVELLDIYTLEQAEKFSEAIKAKLTKGGE